MSQTLAQIAYLSLLKMGTGSPPVYTTVAEVKVVEGFGYTNEFLEATHMESPNRGKEWISGLQDGETLTFTCNLTTANAATLKTAMDAGLNIPFQLDLAGSLPTYSFVGSPASWHILNITPNGILEVECGVKISGGITSTP
jgi:hypothetical protein